MHVASLIIFCHLKKVLRRFCGALLYQISWRVARKADKHGEYGGQQLNSVLTVQLMGFFCCSNEIFLQGCGEKMSWNRETLRTCTHPQTHADNVRQKEAVHSRKSHPYMQLLLLDIRCNTKFLLFTYLAPKVRHKVNSGLCPVKGQNNLLKYRLCF